MCLIIRIILTLCHNANREGILSLENDCHTLKPFILRKGIELVREGIEAEILSEILDNYINVGGYDGLEFFEVVIAKEGVLLIQAGEDIRIIYEKLVSMLGEEFFLYIEKLELLNFINEYHFSQFQNAWKEPDIDNLTFLLDEDLLQITDSKKMLELLQRVGSINMSLALMGVSSNVFQHVIDHLGPYYRWQHLKKEMNKQKPCTIEDIIKAQKHVLYAINFK